MTASASALTTAESTPALVTRRRRSTIAAVVRAPSWFSPKLLPVIAAGELAAVTAHVRAADGVPLMAAMLVAAISVAATAHLANDLADLSSDRAAGIERPVARTTTWQRAVLLLACAAGAVLPWFLVPLPPAAMVILVALVTLSAAYSLPPVRLKARGGIGVAADALVAHALPTAFAMVLLGTPGRLDRWWWTALVAVTVWAFSYGVRNIVIHQIIDRHGDAAAGLGTYVVRRGVPRAVRLARDAVAVEVLALVTLWVVVAFQSIWLAEFFIALFALWAHHRRVDAPPIDMVPTRDGQWLPLAKFYEVWPAVGLGVVLVTRDPGWWWVLGGIIVVFAAAVARQARDLVELIAELVTDVVLHRVVRAWWAVYRGYWRLRARAVDPVLVLIRRNGRRARRIILRRPPR